MMLAYSTIAQMGYMFLLFPLVIGDSIGVGFAWSGGIYFSIAHACAKASAFMVAGSIMFGLGHDRIEDLRGLARSYPLGVFTFALAGTSLMGLPPSGGFIGKWMLLKASMLSGQWWYAILMLIGSILSACYIFRILEVVFQKSEDPDQRLVIPASMKYSALSMACAAIVMGFIANIPFELLKVGSPFSFQSLEGFMK
jgi:formate hydrogenlyase subunit 3/multisubunit Na+/H+ antiporter MnhD subunit